MIARFQVIVLTLSALLLAGCSMLGAASPQGGSAGRSLRMMISAEPDPNPLRRVVSTEVIDSNVLEPLMDLDKSGKPAPRLALTWEAQDNARTWHVTLRKGVKFHNGETLSAKDVVATVKWLIDEKQSNPTYSYVPATDAIQIDDSTVDLKFASPQPLFPIQQIYLLIYPASVAGDPSKRQQAGRAPIGTGPYKFVKWDTGKSISMTRFDDYWGTKPQFAALDVSWRSEPGVRLAALIAGEADWVTDIPIEETSRAPKVVSLPSTDNRYVERLDTIVQQNPLLADKRLRLALDYAIDRDALLKLFNGQAVMLQGQLPLPGEFGFNPNLKPRPFNLDQAKSLVNDAGAVGKTLTMVCGSGKRPKDREMCAAIAGMIEKTGLKVSYQLLAAADEQTYLTTKGPNSVPGKIADIDQSGPDFLFESESRFEKTYGKDSIQVAFSDQTLWDMFAQEKADTNLDSRADKLGKAWAYLYDQAYYIPLVVPTTANGLAANLDWTPNIAGWPAVSDMKFSS